MHVGGSFGRRTSVRGRFDVDLLVFVNDLDTGNRLKLSWQLARVGRGVVRR